MLRPQFTSRIRRSVYALAISCLFVFTSGSLSATQVQSDTACSTLSIATETLSWPPVFSEAEFFSKPEWKSILLLSDGRVERWGDHSIGEKVAREHPHKEVIRTDFEFNGTSKSKKLTTMHLDNTKEFPATIPENSQDVIIMRRGLCICRGNLACAGIDPKSPVATQFFSQVMKAMNKTNPHALAYLHGSHGNNKETAQLWYEAAVKAQSQIEGGELLKVEIVNESSGEFAAIKIGRLP